MERRWRAFRLIISGALTAGVVVLGAGQMTQAQDDDPLDNLRELLPEGDPGDYDLDESDLIFGELVEDFGITAETSDFGDGSKLTGPCGGWATSFDENGDILDMAFDAGDAAPPIDVVDGGQAFTSSNPFKVDTRGVVAYYGFSPRAGDGPIEHRWEIVTSSISVDSGGDPNDLAKNRNAGLVDLDNDLPVKFSAKVQVEGKMTSQNLEACIGQGYVEFIGNGLLDPVGIAGLVLLGGGIFGLLFNARPAQTWKA